MRIISPRNYSGLRRVYCISFIKTKILVFSLVTKRKFWDSSLSQKLFLILYFKTPTQNYSHTLTGAVMNKLKVKIKLSLWLIKHQDLKTSVLNLCSALSVRVYASGASIYHRGENTSPYSRDRRQTKGDNKLPYLEQI
jgi:hypothetical protein